MAIEKINFSYPKGTLQGVFETETLTALELASKTSKKVDECIDIVNAVEQTAIEATAIVGDMRIIQEQFVTDNSDTRQQLISDNQIYLDGLTASKVEFETDLNASKTEFETNMSNAVNEIITNADADIETNVNAKIDNLITDGTINNLINLDTEKTIAESTGVGVVNGIQVLQQSNPNMTVLITGGVAHLYNGKRYEQSDNKTINVEIADASYPRIDIVYINSMGVLSYEKSVAKTAPLAPKPLNALILAEINVVPNTTTILSNNIVDKRIIKENILTSFNNVKNDIKENAKQTDGFINLKSYCVGDGITDDTQGFLNAIAYAKENKKAIYVRGEYLIKQGVIIESATIPEIFGSNRDTDILNFDIATGFAIEAKSYFTRPLKLKNLTIRQKDLSKTASGLKIDFGSWGGGVICENTNIYYFTNEVLNITNGYNSNFTNCEIQGGQQNGLNVAKLLTINKTGSIFSNGNVFNGCTFIFGKMGIQNKGGGTNFIFNNCNFEHLDLFMHILHNAMLTPTFAFNGTWFEDITKGIINAEIDEILLTPIEPITNKANIYNIALNYCYDGGRTPQYVLSSILEPNFYKSFNFVTGGSTKMIKFNGWNTIPLLNGWTGTLKYFKHSNGMVILIGAGLTPGTVKPNTIIAEIPFKSAGVKIISALNGNSAEVLAGAFWLNTGTQMVVPTGVNYASSPHSFSVEFMEQPL